MAGGPNAPRTSQSSSKGGKGSAKPKKKVTVHNEEFEANPLGDEDGCVGQLFHYLWRRNSLGQTCPGINIPDTIVYKYRQPAYWYFTSYQDGLIKKKNRSNITSENIVEAFCKRRRTDPKSEKKEFCAYHLYSLPVSEDPGVDQKLDTTMSVEYFDEQSLRFFLRNGEKHVTSVCQRWIVPKGDRASVIRAAWSPNLCLVERRVNAGSLYDVNRPMHERAVTFEGAEHESESAPLTGTVITEKIQRACNAVVDHIAEVSSLKHRISRMVAHFRVDPEGKIWFLWCSSLRMYRDKASASSSSSSAAVAAAAAAAAAKGATSAVGGGGGGGGGGGDREREKFVAASAQLAPPRAMNLDPEFKLKPQSTFLVQPKKGQMPLLRSNLFACPSCGSACETKFRCEVSFKTCILTHKRKMLEEFGTGAVGGGGGGGGGGEMSVPPVLLKADSRLNAERFEAVKTDPTFLYRTLHMCEECALQHNDVAVDDLTGETPPWMMRAGSSRGDMNHGFGGADATVTVGPHTRSWIGERTSRLVDDVLSDGGASLVHPADTTRGLSARRHTVNFSRIAATMPPAGQPMRGEAFNGGGSRGGRVGVGGGGDVGYRPFSAPAVKGMPGGGGVGGGGLFGGGKTPTRSPRGGGGFGYMTSSRDGSTASPRTQLPRRRVESARLGSGTRPGRSRPRTGTEMGTGGLGRGGGGGGGGGVDVIAATRQRRAGDLRVTEGLYARSQPRYQSLRAQSARGAGGVKVSGASSPPRAAGTRTAAAGTGMGSPGPSSQRRPVHGRVAAASPGRTDGGGDGDELTSEERAFLMGEVGEE